MLLHGEPVIFLLLLDQVAIKVDGNLTVPNRTLNLINQFSFG